MYALISPKLCSLTNPFLDDPNDANLSIATAAAMHPTTSITTCLTLCLTVDLLSASRLDRASKDILIMRWKWSGAWIDRIDIESRAIDEQRGEGSERRERRAE